MNQFVKNVLFVFSLIYSISFLFWGGGEDKYYWYVHTEFYKEDIMNILTFYIGTIWKNIFGLNLYVFRLLGWIMSIAAICLPYFVLLRRKDYCSNLHYLAYGILIMGFWSFQMYSYDSTTMLLLSAIAVLTIKLNLNKLHCLFFISLLSSLAIASRFPNVLLIFPVGIYIGCYFNPNKIRILLYTFLYLILTVLCYYFVVYLLTGNPAVIIALLDSIKMVQSQLGETHDTFNLVKNYITSFIFALNSIPSIILVVLLYFLYRDNVAFSSKGKTLLYIIIFCLLTVNCRFARFYWQVLYSFVIEILILLDVLLNKDADKYKLMLLATMIPIAAAGSDTGLMKMYLLAACFTPIILIKYSKCFKVKEYDIFRGVLLLVMLYSVTTAYITLPAAIRDDQYSKELADNINDYKNFGRSGKTIFYGKLSAHKLYYLTGTPLQYNSSFHQKETNKYEKSRIIELMSNDEEFVLFDFSRSKTFKRELINIGYRLVKEDKTTAIYKKI